MQLIHEHLPSAVARLTPAGRLLSAARLNLSIGLPLRNQAALSNLLQQIYDPASPNYHHYLTPEQFAEQFGPTEKDYQAVIAFANANHLTVTGSHPNRTLVDVNGSVADIEQTLHLTMNSYQHPTENRTFFAPDTEPSLDLAVPILSIGGLNDYSLPHSRLKDISLSNLQNPSPNAGSGPSGTYMGKDFRAAYVPGSTLDGSGQTVGLLQFDGYTASDITYYESHAGLPNVPLQNVLLDGFSGNPTHGGGEVEVSLDIEMAISMATNLSKVIVYEAGPSGSWHDILNRMATDDLARQLSCSWYIPNGGPDPVADQIWLQMAAQGQSFFNASGDNDAYTGLIPFPGDSPYITQVGGTTLTTSGPGGSWVSEKVWNWNTGIGSGGGVSTSYAIPSWQTNISMTANQGSTTKRNTPDVALTADQVYVRADGVDHLVGGTSCAAPLWAGFAALVNQQAANTGKPAIGFINPVIDVIGTGANYSSAFHDITTGNNESSSSPTKFSAVVGYDLCTGWGTPRGQNLIDALANPEPLLITPATGFTSIGGIGGPFTVISQSLSLTNSGTNTLAWSLVNTSLWLNASSGGGTLTPGGPVAIVTVSLNSGASNLLVGTYSATIGFTNLNDNAGQNRQFILSVIAPPTITMQPTNQVVLDGATTVFTVGATGGLPLFYQWQYNSNKLTDGGNIFGSTTTNLVISNVSTNEVGTYMVVVTNFAGAVTSSNALLAITPSAPVITLQPSNQTAVAGTTASFTVAALGSKPFFYQWSFNTTNILGATNTTLTLTNVQFSQAGNYNVLVTNSIGSTLSSNATLNVYLVPLITSLVPNSGPIGTNIIINGTGFDPAASNNIVYFGPVQALVTVASPTSLTVTVPTGATYAPITETVNGLTAYSSIAFSPTFIGAGNIGSASFAPQVTLNVSSGQAGVTVADLDGDGRPDLIALNYYGGSISILRNISVMGTNSFAAPITIAVGGTPIQVAVGDLDGDGRLDLVVVNEGSGTVSVLRNTSTSGNISFASKFDLATASDCRSLLVRDLDGDGRPDIVIASVGSSVVSVYRNLGTPGSLNAGTFAPRVDFATPSGGALTVVAGDLNGDGKPDLVTGNGSSISIFRNTSTLGSIAFASRVDTTMDSWEVAVGDLDGDGKPDLAVANPDNNTVTVLRNTTTTNITFAAGVAFAAGGYTYWAAIGDLNGDGKPDVVTSDAGGNTVSVFQNTGTPGSFGTNSLAPRVTFAVGGGPREMMLADVAGDGRMDIVAANLGSSYASVLQNVIPFSAPPTIISQPTNQTVFVGQTATFNVSANGTSPLNYQWSFNTTNILGATNATLTLTTVQFTQAGNYAVLVTNAFGSTLSSNATLSVNDKLDHFAWSQIPSPRFVNVPFTVVIQALDATNGTFTNFTGTISLSSTNGIPITPPVSAAFVQGLWTGSITISHMATNLVMRADDGSGESGLANSINIVSLPALGFTSSGNFLLVYWPVASSNFVLETSASLSPAQWILASPPLQIGNQYLESIQMNTTSQFYRLRLTVP